MTLSEHELRVLREIEHDLEHSPLGRAVRLRMFIRSHRLAIMSGVLAVMAIVLLAVFASGSVAAPLAGVCGAMAGYRVRCARRRNPYRRRRR